MRTTTFIYTLSCPISGDVRYVGKSNNPKLRLRDHKQMRDNNYHKNKWLKSLKEIKLSPVLTIINEVLISDWERVEMETISNFKKLGCELLNISGGGDGLSFGNQTSFSIGDLSKKVVALNKDGSFYRTFDSITDAKSIGSGVGHVLSGRIKTSGGYIWIYDDVYKTLSKEGINIIVKNANLNLSVNNGINSRFYKGSESKRRKIIHQYTKDNKFIQTHDSITDAAESINGTISQISLCTRGLAKTASNFIWSYEKL